MKNKTKKHKNKRSSLAIWNQIHLDDIPKITLNYAHFSVVCLLSVRVCLGGGCSLICVLSWRFCHLIFGWWYQNIRMHTTKLTRTRYTNTPTTPIEKERERHTHAHSIILCFLSSRLETANVESLLWFYRFSFFLFYGDAFPLQLLLLLFFIYWTCVASSAERFQSIFCIHSSKSKESTNV